MSTPDSELGRWREYNPHLTSAAVVRWIPPGRTGLQTWIGVVGDRQVATIKRQTANRGAECTALLDGWMWNLSKIRTAFGSKEGIACAFPTLRAARAAIAQAIRLHPDQKSPQGLAPDDTSLGVWDDSASRLVPRGKLVWEGVPRRKYTATVNGRPLAELNRVGIGGWAARIYGFLWDVRGDRGASVGSALGHETSSVRGFPTVKKARSAVEKAYASNSLAYAI